MGDCTIHMGIFYTACPTNISLHGRQLDDHGRALLCDPYEVLRLEPNNEAARRELEKLEAQPGCKGFIGFMRFTRSE